LKIQAVSAFRRRNLYHHMAVLASSTGLFYMFIFLGNIGAIDHYEYRPVGDIVNTATRIEGLNKQLGTNILVSDEVLQQTDGLLSREMGAFLFVGKSKPIVVHELIALMEKSTPQQRELCSFFSEALASFKQKLWEEACSKFHELIKIFGDDGPSTSYIRLCNQFRENPHEEAWEGIVRVDNK